MKHPENKIGLDLKYCERCGGLWLRRRGDSTAYCRACAPAMAGPRTRRRRLPRGQRRRQ